jgi:uncharacterized protein YdhG (YjbR/CyaY superfamily)
MKAYKNIDDYIHQFPDDSVQSVLNKLRQTIHAAAPKAQEAIKYGIPTFTLNGNLVHFGAFKNHIGFFPTPTAIVAFKKDLSEYKISKGTVQFPLDKPIPYGLVKKIVQYRVKQIKK